MMDDIQERISLGQAKNQATIILADVWFKAYEKDRETQYKQIVKTIYKWNREIDEELLKTGEGGGKDNHVSTPDNEYPCSKPSPSPSPKQKYCPKCKDIIPKTWDKHIKCGWKQ